MDVRGPDAVARSSFLTELRRQFELPRPVVIDLVERAVIEVTRVVRGDRHAQRTEGDGRRRPISETPTSPRSPDAALTWRQLECLRTI